ncbi:MAG: condensation domain-containing protein, partial [Myxococcota bacterium]
MLEHDAGLRLSPQQRRLWSLSRHAGPAIYRIAFAVDLIGLLSRDALAAALDTLTRRHEILRTSLDCPAGLATAVQIVREDAALALGESDLSELPADRREPALAELQRAVSAQVSAAESPPALHLVRLSDQQHILLGDLPALGADGQSVTNLVAELAQLYGSGPGADAHPGGAGPGAAELDDAVQYADVAEIFNEFLESDETATGREYWQRHTTPVLDRATTAQAYAPQRIPVAIPATLRAGLNDLCREGRPTSADALLAAWVAVLWRLDMLADDTVYLAYPGRN